MDYLLWHRETKKEGLAHVPSMANVFKRVAAYLENEEPQEEETAASHAHYNAVHLLT